MGGRTSAARPKRRRRSGTPGGTPGGERAGRGRPPGTREQHTGRGVTRPGHPTTTPGPRSAVSRAYRSGTSPAAWSYGCAMPRSLRSQAHPHGQRSGMWKRHKRARHRESACCAARPVHATRERFRWLPYDGMITLQSASLWETCKIRHTYATHNTGMAGMPTIVRRTTRISIEACMGVRTRWPLLDARLWDTPGHVSRAHPNGGRGVGARSRPRQGDADEARGSGGARRPDWPPGLAQDPPVRAGRGERPTGVGRPGGGALPCGARL